MKCLSLKEAQIHWPLELVLAQFSELVSVAVSSSSDSEKAVRLCPFAPLSTAKVPLPSSLDLFCLVKFTTQEKWRTIETESSPAWTVLTISKCFEAASWFLRFLWTVSPFRPIQLFSSFHSHFIFSWSFPQTFHHFLWSSHRTCLTARCFEWLSGFQPRMVASRRFEFVIS